MNSYKSSFSRIFCNFWQIWRPILNYLNTVFQPKWFWTIHWNLNYRFNLKLTQLKQNSPLILTDFHLWTFNAILPLFTSLRVSGLAFAAAFHGLYVDVEGLKDLSYLSWKMNYGRGSYSFAWGPNTMQNRQPHAW